MKRRDAIKGCAILSTWVLFPNKLFSCEEINHPLHLVGLGGAGCNALELIYNKNINARFTGISELEKRSEPLSGINYIDFIPPKRIHLKTADEDYSISDMSQKLVLPDHIKKLFEENHRYVLLAGLGGYTGSYMIEELALLLSKWGKDFSIICSLPFSFEDSVRKSIAWRVVHKLHPLNRVKYFDLDTIRDKYGDISLKHAFQKGDEQFFRLFGKLRVNA